MADHPIVLATKCLITPETPRAACSKRKYCVAGGRGIGGYHSAVESPERAEMGRVKRQRTSSCFHHILLLRTTSPSVSVCVRDSLFPCYPSLPSPSPSRSPLLAPLSSCFSGFLNCDISAAAPPPSSSSYCSCSSSSSPPRAMCGKSN